MTPEERARQALPYEDFDGGEYDYETRAIPAIAAAIREALDEATKSLQTMPTYGTVPFIARDDALAAIEALKGGRP